MISVCTRRLALYVLSLCMSVNIQAASISSIHTNSSGEQSDSLSFRTPFYSSETTHNPTDEDLIIPVDPAKPPVPIDSIWPIDPILPYPQDPEQPRNPYDGYSVGTPKGSLSVNKLGATVFNLQIKVPDGGPLTPVIGLSYNSQSARVWACRIRVQYHRNIRNHASWTRSVSRRKPARSNLRFKRQSAP